MHFPPCFMLYSVPSLCVQFTWFQHNLLVVGYTVYVELRMWSMRERMWGEWDEDDADGLVLSRDLCVPGSLEWKDFFFFLRWVFPPKVIFSTRTRKKREDAAADKTGDMIVREVEEKTGGRGGKGTKWQQEAESEQLVLNPPAGVSWQCLKSVDENNVIHAQQKWKL